MADIFNFVSYSCDQKINDCSSKVQKIASNKLLFTYPCESLTDCFPYNVTIRKGIYRIDLYGAQGGDARYHNNKTMNANSGGKGAHVSGNLRISDQNQTLYFYIGGKGEDQSTKGDTIVSRGGYNGGGNGGIDINPQEDYYHESAAGGGGATDIRLEYSKTFDSFESLQSRIAVAAGGGGAVSDTSSQQCIVDVNHDSAYLCLNNDSMPVLDYRGGPAGKLHGYSYSSLVFPPNQTFGNFGRGSDGINISVSSGGSIGGAGGGYFGGTCSTNESIPWAYVGGGSGGCSYISGYNGCITFQKDPKNEINSTPHIHYSNIVFTNTNMHSGLELFTDEYGNNVIGHSNSGSIIITYIRDSYITQTSSFTPNIQLLILSLAIQL